MVCVAADVRRRSSRLVWCLSIGWCFAAGIFAFR